MYVYGWKMTHTKCSTKCVSGRGMRVAQPNLPFILDNQFNSWRYFSRSRSFFPSSYTTEMRSMQNVRTCVFYLFLKWMADPHPFCTTHKYTVHTQRSLQLRWRKRISSNWTNEKLKSGELCVFKLAICLNFGVGTRRAFVIFGSFFLAQETWSTRVGWLYAKATKIEKEKYNFLGASLSTFISLSFTHSLPMQTK